MKPAPFDLVVPSGLAEAQAALRDPMSRIMAGGQSLGPMLNLRLVRPARIVPITHLPELGAAFETADAITLGACITHAAIADGRTPDLAGGILAKVAENIAYRAVRNRGTIGGSLCHADPAADWPCVLTALGAVAVIAGTAGDREMPLADFIRGAFRVALEPGEILRAIRIPRPSPEARWAYVKSCRKPGEFAHAMAAVLIDGSMRRQVIGATGGKPLPVTGDPEAALRDCGLDAIGRHMQMVALRRALDRATA